jgi:hypothetical protein
LGSASYHFEDVSFPAMNAIWFCPEMQLHTAETIVQFSTSTHAKTRKFQMKLRELD